MVSVILNQKLILAWLVCTSGYALLLRHDSVCAKKFHFKTPTLHWYLDDSLGISWQLSVRTKMHGVVANLQVTLMCYEFLTLHNVLGYALCFKSTVRPERNATPTPWLLASSTILKQISHAVGPERQQYPPLMHAACIVSRVCGKNSKCRCGTKSYLLTVWNPLHAVWWTNAW